jgi:hypothetical protein
VPFYVGSPVPLTYTSTDTSGNLQNTAPVTVTVTQPDGTTGSAGPVSNPSQGIYTATFAAAQAGHHLVQWTAGGSFPGALTDSFDIWPLTESAILPFADAKRTLRIGAGDTSEDDFVREFNEAVTNVVEWYCGPVMVQTVVEELRVGGLTVMLSKPPVISLTAWTSVPSQFSADTSRVVPSPPSPMFPVMVYGVTYPLAQLYADKVRGEVRHTAGLPFYYGPFLWQYQAGRPVIPMCITNGARAILKHLYGLERGGGGGTAIGQADEETSMTPFGFAVPNRALEMMAPEALAGAIA